MELSIEVYKGIPAFWWRRVSRRHPAYHTQLPQPAWLREFYVFSQDNRKVLTVKVKQKAGLPAPTKAGNNLDTTVILFPDQLIHILLSQILHHWSSVKFLRHSAFFSWWSIPLRMVVSSIFLSFEESFQIWRDSCIIKDYSICHTGKRIFRSAVFIMENSVVMLYNKLWSAAISADGRTVPASLEVKSAKKTSAP